MTHRKQIQNRPKTRAPQGYPEFTERVAAYVTSRQKSKFMRMGGSQWLRALIDAAPNNKGRR